MKNQVSGDEDISAESSDVCLYHLLRDADEFTRNHLINCGTSPARRVSVPAFWCKLQSLAEEWRQTLLSITKEGLLELQRLSTEQALDFAPNQAGVFSKAHFNKVSDMIEQDIELLNQGEETRIRIASPETQYAGSTLALNVNGTIYEATFSQIICGVCIATVQVSTCHLLSALQKKQLSIGPK